MNIVTPSCFIGHIVGIDDVVGFHGESVAELQAAFEEAVDDYLQTCEKLNRSLQKSKIYSGNLYKEPIMSDRETERTFYEPQDAEIFFGDFCRDIGVYCCAVKESSEPNEKRPDFVIFPSGHPIIVEVKQVCLNKKDRESIESFIDLCTYKGMFYSLSCAYLKKPRIRSLS